MIWLYLVIAFYVGLFIGLIMQRGLARRRSYSGIMNVVKHPDKTVFTLDVHEDPVLLIDKDEVIFKVVTSEEDSPNRE